MSFLHRQKDYHHTKKQEIMSKTVELQIEKGRYLVEGLREELQPKVKHMNSMLVTVKTAYAEAKKTLKGYYPQERWADYGVPDKR